MRDYVGELGVNKRILKMNAVGTARVSLGWIYLDYVRDQRGDGGPR